MICGNAAVGFGKFSLSIAEIRLGQFHIPLDALVRTVFVLAFISAAPDSPPSPTTHNHTALEPLAVVSDDNSLLMDVKLFNVN